MGDIVHIDFSTVSQHDDFHHVEDVAVHYEHLTLERLEEMLDYDPLTGSLTWRQRPFAKSRKRPGDIAGSIKGNGYRYIGIDSRAYMASQLAFFHHFKRWPRGDVGPKNGDPSDLRPSNLVEKRTTAARHDLNTKEGRLRYRRDYWAENPDYRRDLHFKRYYGMDVAEYKRLLDVQGGVCAICKGTEKTKRGDKLGFLAVDHCHKTGDIRGLLCSSCNTGIGRFADDPELVDRAAAYLRSHQQSSEKNAA
jgi:hypothetical protein